MEQCYQTLKTIYEIARHDSSPTTYQCRPREIILRLFLDWGIIQQHLKILEAEGLIVTRQLDTLVISITAAGIEKAAGKSSVTNK